MINADKWVENDFVFPNLMGNPIDPNNLINDLRKLLKQAQLPAIRFHGLLGSAPIVSSGSTQPAAVPQKDVLDL